MPVTRTNIVLSVLLALVILATVATRVDFTRPNIEVLPDMKYTPAWTAYESNPCLPNRQTLQAPVAGTIARGQMPLHFEATKEDALRAGDQLVNPISAASADTLPEQLQASVQRGGDNYRVFCIVCHGPNGAGNGPVAQRGFPPPPSLLTGKSLAMKEGQLFHIMTYGQGNMPGFAGQISREQRWDLVNYVRSIQPTQQDGSATEPNPMPERNFVENGEEQR